MRYTKKASRASNRAVALFRGDNDVFMASSSKTMNL